MRFRSILCWLLIVSVTLPWCCANAEPNPRVVALRAEYLRLRNNDPGGDAAQFGAQWRSLFSRMRTALSSAGNDGEGIARLRLYAADTGLRLYRSSGQQQFLREATAMLDPLLKGRAAGDDRAAALIMMGDAELVLSAEDSKAAELYRQAARIGGATDAQAQQRLQGLKNGTLPRLHPSSDVEVPRLVHPVALRQRWSIGPVVIDPGHGGYDAGAVGLGGLEEKEVTLDIALRVRKILVERYSLPTLLTRDSDEFVPLARRTAYANSKGASVFVSLHLNASPSHEAQGLEAYYLDNTNDAASRKLAERENGTETGEDVDDLSFMLSDLIQSGKIEDSIRLTGDINGSLKERVAPSYRRARFLGVKKAPFFVLVGAHMPCSLVEMFFVDHVSDGSQLTHGEFRQELAAGIAHGIAKFVLADARLPARLQAQPVSAQNESARIARTTPSRRRQ